MPSKWIDHVKQYASDNNMKYNIALKDPKCKEAYKSSGKGLTSSKIAPEHVTPSQEEEPDKYANIESNDDDEPLFRIETREIDSIPLDEYPELLKHLEFERNFHSSYKHLVPMTTEESERHSDEIARINKDIAYVKKALSKMKGKGLRAVAKKMHGKGTCGGALKDYVSPTAWKDYTTSIVKGRNDYPPKMREIIQKYGDKQIVRMQACRTPLSSFMTTALNIASLGEFNKRFEKSPHDQLFHLDLRVEVIDEVKGKKRLTTVLLEKTEVLNASVNPKKAKNAECSLIQNVKKPLTIHEMLEGAKKIQGDKFFKYSANNNNCQDFIIALLKGVGAGNEENYTFIKQDTRSLFKDMPFFRKLTNTVTDIGAVANTVIEGQGISKKRLLKDIQRMEETSKYFLEILPQNNRSRGHLRNFVQDATNLKNSIKNNGTEENLRAILDYIKSMRRIVDDVHRRLYPGENPDTDKELNTDEEDDDQFNEEDFIDGFGVKTASSYVQTIIFDKSKFDKKSARKWIKEHKYADKGVDEKEDTFRFRQVNPRYIQKMGFDKFRTKKLGKNSGVSIVLAYKV